MRTPLAALVLALLFAGSSQAVSPAVPAAFSYQGVLLDSGGQPQSGPVDLAIRLWDQGFAGTLLYKQEFNNTALVDGVFSLQLGPTGVGTDIPVSPLTLDLIAAVTTDLGASGSVWIEVSVDGNAPLARTQLRAVPFALKAESAVSAETATNILTPAGVDAAILDAVWQNFNFDGGPANTDPAEGTGDTDLDGILNFVDADNDNDGLSDAAEVTQGSDINLVTPRIDSFSGNGRSLFGTSLSATGDSFDPAMTATLGPEAITPTNVTQIQFDFVAPAMSPGPHSLVVMHPNGEVGSADLIYDNVILGGVDDPIEAVALGTDQLLVHSDANYVRDTADDGVLVLGPVQTFALGDSDTTSIHWDSTGRLAALRRTDITGFIEVVIDTDLDGILEPTEAIQFFSVLPNVMTAPSIIHDNTDRIAFAYLRRTATHTHARIIHDRNANGDFVGEDELADLMTGAGGGTALGELAADSAARLAYVYEAPSLGEIRVSWDRNGDGDYNDTVSGNPEVFSAATAAPTCLGSDFDSSDALVVVYGDAGGLHLLRDTSGDGDFADAGEDVIVVSAGQVSTPMGCDVDASGSGLAIAVTDGSNLSILVDRNGDDDFADSNEDELLSTAAAAPIAVERLGNGTAVIAGPNFVTPDPN